MSAVITLLFLFGLYFLPGLIARLSPDPQTAEQALRDLTAQAVTTNPVKRMWRARRGRRNRIPDA